MALYFYFNETTGDLVYSDKATYGGSGYTSLGQQTNTGPFTKGSWKFHSVRDNIKTVTKDPATSSQIDVLTRTNGMFGGCTALTSLDLSGFDTSNVTDMSDMFEDCQALTSLDLSDFDTSNVENMLGMFESCQALTSLDLSGFNMSGVTNVMAMFSGCTALTSLDLSGFDTSNVTSRNRMFASCTNLRLVTISDKMSNILSSLPDNRYYPASGGEPVASANLTAGTWVRDEADLTMVTSIVQQAQMSQAISRRIGSLRRDLEAQVKEVSALLAGLTAPSVDVVRTTEHTTGYAKDTLEIVCDSSGKVTAMYFVSA